MIVKFVLLNVFTLFLYFFIWSFYKQVWHDAALYTTFNMLALYM